MPNSRARAWVLALVGLVVALACFLLLGERERRAADAPGAPAPVSTPAPAQLAAPELERAPRAPLSAAVAPSASAASTPTPEPTSANRWTARGTLLEGATHAPVVGATLVLQQKGQLVPAHSDENGRFAFELDGALCPLGTLVGVQASFADPHRIVFLGDCVLAPEFVLVAHTRLTLRGVLVAEAGEELGLGAQQLGASAYALAPDDPLQPPLFAGSGLLDPEQRFEFEAWVARVPAAFRLKIGSHAGELFSLDVAAAELTSSAGATIVLTQAALEIALVDESGQPLAGAELRVRALPLENGADMQGGTSGASGTARFRLPPGQVEIAAGKPGYSAHAEVLELSVHGASVRIALRQLGADDLLEGVVLDAEQRPIADAWVSAFPHTLDPEVSVAGAVGQRSDTDGRFALALGGEGEFQLVASHRTLGMSRELTVHARERGVVLVIEPQGALEVTLDGRSESEATTRGGYDWLLVDAQGAALASGHDWAASFTIEPVPAGELELHVRRVGSELFGSTGVSVARGATTHVRLALAPVRRVRGTLVSADGAPATDLALTLEGTSLIPAAAALFATGRTDVRGGFDLLFGDARAGVLVVTRPDAAAVRFHLEAGECGALVVP